MQSLLPCEIYTGRAFSGQHGCHLILQRHIFAYTTSTCSSNPEPIALMRCRPLLLFHSHRLLRAAVKLSLLSYHTNACAPALSTTRRCLQCDPPGWLSASPKRFTRCIERNAPSPLPCASAVPPPRPAAKIAPSLLKASAPCEPLQLRSSCVREYKNDCEAGT
jgi:hypothetical protein